MDRLDAEMTHRIQSGWKNCKRAGIGGCKTSSNVRCRDVGSDESTREEVGCGGNEDVKMDEWSHQAGPN